jgi:uncharacterized membrane protein YbaN (DUF454 family)
MDQKQPNAETLRQPKPLPALVRVALLIFALANLALGVLGIFVPGLPTTVFILLAAWAASKSSPRLNSWLWNHPRFGALLRNWANGGRMGRQAKWAATLVMSSSATILLLSNTARWMLVTALLCMAAVLAWLWHRPEP